MKSISERVWIFLKDRKVGKTISCQQIITRMKLSEEQRPAVFAFMSKLYCTGGIDRALGKGNYVISQNTSTWGNFRAFHKAPPKGVTRSRGLQPHAEVIEKREPAIIRNRVIQQTTVRHDNPIIENLLNAMADAEAELERLVELDKKVKELR